MEDIISDLGQSGLNQVGRLRKEEQGRKKREFLLRLSYDQVMAKNSNKIILKNREKEENVFYTLNEIDVVDLQYNIHTKAIL